MWLSVVAPHLWVYEGNANFNISGCHSIAQEGYTVLYGISREEAKVVRVLCLTNYFVLLLNQQPADCRILIEKLKACSDEQLLVELQHIKTWNIGKVSPSVFQEFARDWDVS